MSHRLTRIFSRGHPPPSRRYPPSHPMSESKTMAFFMYSGGSQPSASAVPTGPNEVRHPNAHLSRLTPTNNDIYVGVRGPRGETTKKDRGGCPRSGRWCGRGDLNLHSQAATRT